MPTWRRPRYRYCQSNLKYFLLHCKAELEEVKDDLKVREMKAKDCMIDASKIAEELHNEQEQAGVIENERKLLESKLKEIQVTLKTNGSFIELFYVLF